MLTIATSSTHRRSSTRMLVTALLMASALPAADDITSGSFPATVSSGSGTARITVNFTTNGSGRHIWAGIFDNSSPWVQKGGTSVDVSGTSATIDIPYSSLNTSSANYWVGLYSPDWGTIYDSITGTSSVSSGGATGNIPANDSNLRYIGRVDWADSANPKISYSGTFLKCKFNGTSLKAKFSERNWGDGTWVGARIDGGNEIAVYMGNGLSDQTLTIATGLSNSTHSLELYRRTPPDTGWLQFKGLVLDTGKGLSANDAAPSRRIAVFGDSITAGSAVMPNENKGQADSAINLNNWPNGKHHNGYYTYGAMIGRTFGADVSIQGFPGIGLNRGKYWMSHLGANSPGLIDAWNDLDPIEQTTYTGFGSWVPQVVVIAVAQNDGSVSQNDVNDWKTKYKTMLDNLRGNWPSAKYVLTTSIMNHDTTWDTSVLPAIKNEYNSAKGISSISTYKYNRAGVGTPGHPRIDEQQEMADELVTHIKTLGLGW